MSRHKTTKISKNWLEVFSHVKNWKSHTDPLQQVGVFSIIQDPIMDRHNSSWDEQPSLTGFKFGAQIA